MDDQPTENTEDNEKSVSSNLSSADIKLLVITFAGTIAANLVTVLFVGLAIALTHYIRPTQGGTFEDALTAFLTLGAIVFPFAWLTVLSRLRKRRNLYERRGEDIPYLDLFLRRTVIVSGIVAMGVLVMVVLTWVGIAAGIK
jgi:hypothetical protein